MNSEENILPKSTLSLPVPVLVKSSRLTDASMMLFSAIVCAEAGFLSIIKANDHVFKPHAVAPRSSRRASGVTPGDPVEPEAAPHNSLQNRKYMVERMIAAMPSPQPPADEAEKDIRYIAPHVSMSHSRRGLCNSRRPRLNETQGAIYY